MNLISKNYAHFLHMANQYPMLSLSEEIYHFEQFKQFNHKESLQKILYSHLKLVAKVVRDYKYRWSNLLELCQQGTLGLLKAIYQYNHNQRENRFASYALPWIDGEIKQFLSHFIGKNEDIDDYIDILEDDYSIEDEISQKNEQKYVLEKMRNLDDRERYIISARYLEEPPVLRDKIATDLGISTERVRQIENKALNKLKQYLDYHNTSIMIEEIKKS